MIEYENSSPTSSLVYGFMQLFAQKYDCEIRYKRTKDISSEDIRWCDCVLSIRGSNPASYMVASCAKRSQRILYTVYDDDLLNLPGNFPVISDRKVNVRKILSLSEAVITGNRLIGEDYGKYTDGNYVILHTIVDAESFVEPKKEKNGKVKLLYAANKQHIFTFNKYIKPILGRLSNEFKDIISLNFIGIEPELSEYESEVEINYLPYMPLDVYRKHVAEQHYDIGIAPLEDTAFCNRKYFNKFIEYTSAGTFGIYSNCIPYTWVVESRENGLLCENTPEDWYNAIREAIINNEMRYNCVKNAQDYLKKEHNEDAILEKTIELLPNLVNYASPKDCRCRIGAVKVVHLLFRMRECCYQGLVYVKNEGLKKTIKKVIEHFQDVRRFNG